MKRWTLVLGVVFSWILNAPAFGGGRTDISPSDNQTTVKGIISIYSDWVKDKGKKYDISLHIVNEHDKGIIVLLKELRCYRGAVQGELKHTFFNTGERTIDFGTGQKKSFKMVCKLDTKEKGEYRITIGKVYENASGDGKTLGKVLATDVNWKVLVAE